MSRAFYFQPLANPKAQTTAKMCSPISPLYGLISISPLKEPFEGNLGVPHTKIRNQKLLCWLFFEAVTGFSNKRTTILE